MLIRNGFITNSSSTAYVFWGAPTYQDLAIKSDPTLGIKVVWLDAPYQICLAVEETDDRPEDHKLEFLVTGDMTAWKEKIQKYCKLNNINFEKLQLGWWTGNVVC